MCLRVYCVGLRVKTLASECVCARGSVRQLLVNVCVCVRHLSVNVCVRVRHLRVNACVCVKYLHVKQI